MMPNDQNHHALHYAKPNAHASNAPKFTLAAVGLLIGYVKWNALHCAITPPLIIAVV